MIFPVTHTSTKVPSSAKKTEITIQHQNCVLNALSSFKKGPKEGGLFMEGLIVMENDKVEAYTW